MTTHGRTRAAALLALPVIGLLAACGSDAPIPTSAVLSCDLEAGPVVFAGAARANMAKPEITSAVQAVVDAGIASGSYFAVYDADATPTKLAGAELKSTASNEVAQAKERKRIAAGVIKTLSGARTDGTEADPLLALTLAGQELRSHGSAGTIVLVDSGLQTHGALTYQHGNLLLASGSDIAAHLKAQRQLPDLKGATVVLSGLGATAPPQEQLDIASRSRLVEQWTAIAKAAGASCVAVDEQPMTRQSEGSLHKVTPVSVPKPKKPEPKPGKDVPLREDSMPFKDNSAELRDPAGSKAVVAELAKVIIVNHSKVILTGTTATAGTEEGRQGLSLARAEAVKGLLVAAGVPAAHIATKGVGIHHPMHVDDIGANGSLDPVKAVQNRAVFVTLR